MASITLNPSSYNSTYSSFNNFNTSYPATNMYSGASSTSYGYPYANIGSNVSSYISLAFDTSSIPSNATIDSVSCNAKYRTSNTTNITSCSVQLYNGNTAKGTANTTNSTTASSRSITTGTWTRTEIDNILLRFTFARGTSNTTRNAGIYIYGADLTITYTESKVQYTVTISSTGNGTTSPTGTQTIDEGNSIDITIAPNSTDIVATVIDNDIDVTNSLTTVGTNYKYSLSNISANHTISITYAQAIKYTVTTSITNGVLNSPAESVQITQGSTLDISFKGNDNTRYVGMTINGSTVSATKVTGQNSTAATYTISSNYSTYSGALTDIDSDTSSYWWSSEAQATGKYVLFTFNKLINLTDVATYSSNSTDYPHSCNKLQASTDGNTWMDLGTFNDQQTNVFNGLTAKNIKYVRIYCDSTGVSNWLVLNTVTFTYTTPEIASGYLYTISSVDGDKTIEITFASNSKVMVKISGKYVEGTAYKKENGVWSEITPKNLSIYLADKKIKKN